MLRIFLASLILFFSFGASACWKIKGEFSLKEEKWKFDQKISSNQEIVLPAGEFILRIKTKIKNKKIEFFYIVEKKEGLNLQLIGKGSAIIVTKEIHHVFVKGEPGQPNSNISFKLKNI